MPPTLKETTTTFTKPEPIFQIKCDVHPWMTAYIGVFTHPFFSVDGHGREVHDLGPRPGDVRDHRLAREWDGGLATQTASVTVGATDTKTQNFKFALPK